MGRSLGQKAGNLSLPPAGGEIGPAGRRRRIGGNPLLQRLAKAGAWFEIATLEGVAGIESLLQRLPDLRLSFGSHAPYFYFEAALLKLQESDLSPAQLAAVRHANAQAALV